MKVIVLNKISEVKFVSQKISPVRISTSALLLLGSDDGLQILLPPLLPVVVTVGRCSASDLFGLVDGSFLEGVGAIHGVGRGLAGDF